MSEIEKRQRSFEQLLEDYSPLEFPPISENQPSGAAADLAYQNAVRQQLSEPGNIPEGSQVVSVYDVRPINAVDFNLILVPIVLSLRVGQFSFTVPAGRNCIIKWFTFQIDITL